VPHFGAPPDSVEGHFGASSLRRRRRSGPDRRAAPRGSRGSRARAEQCRTDRRQGRRVTVEFRAARIYGADGACSGAVVALRDITRRRAAELALQSSEETLLANAQALFEEKERAQVTLNSIGDAVISTDFRGRVSFLNIVAERMTGRTQAEAADSKSTRSSC